MIYDALLVTAILSGEATVALAVVLCLLHRGDLWMSMIVPGTIFGASMALLIAAH